MGTLRCIYGYNSNFSRISDAQQKGNEQLQQFLDSRPNLKQAIDSGKPDFMKGLTNAMPHLMSA